jgi:hypothetical protein
MTLQLPRFQLNVPLVGADGKPTQTFHQWWDTVAKNIESNFNALAQTVLDIQTALATAQAAAREAARLTSYPSPGSVLTASDAGTDATITIAGHTRVYPVQGSIDVPDVVLTGGTITGRAYSTQYFIYYDDTTLANTTPTFLATTTSATAQVGAAAGRHFIGYVTTPASGGGSTGGTGGGPPGGGGGLGGGGVQP